MNPDLQRMLRQIEAINSAGQAVWPGRRDGSDEGSDGVTGDPVAADAPRDVLAIRDHARPAPPVAGSAGAKRLIRSRPIADTVRPPVRRWALTILLVIAVPL